MAHVCFQQSAWSVDCGRSIDLDEITHAEYRIDTKCQLYEEGNYQWPLLTSLEMRILYQCDP